MEQPANKMVMARTGRQRMIQKEKVYIVMGNDFPDAVFRTEEGAEKYCHEKPKIDAASNRRIYWRWYEFEVKE